MRLSTGILKRKSDPDVSTLLAYEVNEDWMTKLQGENERLLDMLHQVGSSVQFIDERRDILDLIVVEKCISIEEQAEQCAILSSPQHRDFYLLLQRKLKCMIKACESLSTGMVGVKDGDLRTFAAQAIHETGCKVLKETKLGYLIGSAVAWSKNNIAAIPFVDTIGSIFQLIVTLKFEHDRYLGLARVADFATMVCLPQYGATSLDSAIEKLARLIVRARCGLPSCKFVEKGDEFGKIKQLMVNLLADSGNTPAKEQASIAADCAFAHIMKPSNDSALFGVLNDSILNIGLNEALAASILGISLENVRKLDQFSLLAGAEIPPKTVTPCKSKCYVTSDELSNSEAASISSSVNALSYASSGKFINQVDKLYEHEAKIREQEEKVLEQDGKVQEQKDKIQEQDEKIQQLSRQVATLQNTIKESNSHVNYDAGGGFVYANPAERFENEIVGIQTDNVQLDQRLRDQATEIDDLKSRLMMLERQLS